MMQYQHRVDGKTDREGEERKWRERVCAKVRESMTEREKERGEKGKSEYFI